MADGFDHATATLARVGLNGQQVGLKNKYSGISILEGWPLEGGGSWEMLPLTFRGKLRSYSIGANHLVAVNQEGKVFAWGDNQFGQKNIPNGLNSVKQVSCGYMHTIALNEDGTVVTWGGNWEPANLNNPPLDLKNVKSVFAGSGSSFAIKEDGTVVAWGANQNGIINVPNGLNNVKTLSIKSHVLALKADGTVVAWGNNSYGQTNVPNGLNGVVAIAAGEGFSVALKENGTILSWGLNGILINTDAQTLVGIKDISAGFSSGCYALHDDGSITRWGSPNWSPKIWTVLPSGKPIQKFEFSNGWISWVSVE